MKENLANLNTKKLHSYVNSSFILKISQVSAASHKKILFDIESTVNQHIARKLFSYHVSTFLYPERACKIKSIYPIMFRSVKIILKYLICMQMRQERFSYFYAHKFHPI